MMARTLPHTCLMQVEFFNPVQYEGEMGSQQPADRWGLQRQPA